jgi:hypothetical protein
VWLRQAAAILITNSNTATSGSCSRSSSSGGCGIHDARQRARGSRMVTLQQGVVRMQRRRCRPVYRMCPDKFRLRLLELVSALPLSGSDQGFGRRSGAAVLLVAMRRDSTGR